MKMMMKMKDYFNMLFFIPGIFGHQMVAYWGQNGVSNSVESFQYEKNLLYYCQNMDYDIIAIGFLNIFFDERNKDELPSINLSYHCETPISDEYPALFYCPNIAKEIIECQKQNIKIILSLGGAIGEYGFKSQKEAHLFADRVWNLFLGGESNLRTFGNAILDGIDLDIEGHGAEYYTDFVTRLRSHTSSDASKTYLITASPQCPYPDKNLGPGKKGDVLTDIGHEFDYLFVQFYNNFCHPGSGFFNIDKWLNYANNTYVKKGKGPKVVMGLPSGIRASGHPIYFKSVNTIKDVYEKDLQSKIHFGGIMIWDAGFDGNSIENGKSYSQQLGAILKRTDTKATIQPVTKRTPSIATTTSPSTTTKITKSEGNSQTTLSKTPLKLQTTQSPTTSSSTNNNNGNTDNSKQNVNNSTVNNTDEHDSLKLLLYICLGGVALLTILIIFTITLVCKLLSWKNELMKSQAETSEVNPYSNISELKHEIKYYQPSI